MHRKLGSGSDASRGCVMARGAKRLLKGGIASAAATRAGAILPAESIDDSRAQGIARANRDTQERRERALAALKEAGAQLDDEQFEEVLGGLRRLGTAARDMKVWMLETGRQLLRLQELVGPGGYKALVRAGLVDIPESVASALRGIAQAVTAGSVDPRLLPGQVKPAYELAKLARLEPRILEAVTERVRLGPATSTREIQAAAAEVRAEVHRQAIQAPERGRRSKHGEQQDERQSDRLERKIAKLERQR